MSLTESAARAFVAAYAATATNPVLSDDEIALCLAQARVIDPAGRAPSDPAWTPTYWGARAVVAALELKIAKVAAKVDLTADGTTINASQVTANLTALRRSWRAKLTQPPAPARPASPSMCDPVTCTSPCCSGATCLGPAYLGYVEPSCYGQGY